ncbi:acyl-CoA dehydrogenase family protein [Peribacillus frigoritolerans]|uniref:acyl-CoA dehydrogenase family protein n=1 Tax=Peribacillus frigoritolerans TaxID=450367 RepID=UPI003514B92E
MKYKVMENQQELRKSVRKFVQKEIVPNNEEWEKNGFPNEIFRKMGQMGLFGVRYPEEYGGSNLDYFAAMTVTEEIASSGCAGLGMAFNVQALMATNPILKFGTEEQKRKYLVPSIAGEKIAALGITEPSAGSDVAGLRTTAKKTDGGWIINGSKVFITNGIRADYQILIAKTGEKNGRALFSIFLVDSNLEGYTVGRKLEKIGMHASDTAEIFLENVFVPDDALLGKEGEGFKQLMWQLNGERLIQATACVAGAQRCLDLAVQYAKEREQFGRSLSKNQVIRHYLAEMQTEVEAARALLYNTASQYNEGEVLVKEISMTKLLASKVYYEVADKSLQIHGGYGYMDEYPISREWRDARLMRIGGGTDEVQKEIIAKEMNL